MFVSLIVQMIWPGGDANEAEPCREGRSSLINTRRVAVFCSSVTRPARLVTVPTPVYIVPPQQKRYDPLELFTSTTGVGPPSSCKQMSNAVTVKLHVAVLPEVSVAVQVTVVVPSGKLEPDVGLQTTPTPGQLSVATGAG
jgi:hypothetical protein